MLTYSITAALTLLALFLVKKTVHVFVVQDVERALLIRKGRSAGELAPGVHWVLGTRVAVQRFDAREQALVVSPQEITTADPMSVKASAAVRYRIAEPERVREASTLHTAGLHLLVQLALRDAIARFELEALLADRSAASALLQERVAPEARRLGLEVVGAAVLDVVVRGELKQALGQAVQARAEARAKLERARGETAALRHLGNAARMLEKNAGLAQLRLLETLQRAAEGTGNSLVLGVGGGIGLNLLGEKS